ncbi:MAG TPA: hypothetical protein VG452_02710, partial [Egibacteraceae bacterium]|nr:hypothetical protein [Egibacteraceae bacterium]
MLVAMVVALVGPGGQRALAASQQIASDGPLTRIEISDDLNCAVWHAQDAEPEFYGETACATLAAVDGVLYSPEVIPGGLAAEGTPYTPVSQQPVQGSGSDADPYRIVTVVALGPSGLQITQTDSYVAGQESYRTDVAIANTSSAAKSLTLWRAGDCNLQDSDFGFGSADPVSGAVACVAPDPANPEAPGDRVEQWLPISAGSAYYEHERLDLWARIGAQRPFDNTCSCAEKVDNGAGLSWQLTVPAGASAVRSHLTTFSPLGWVPLTTAKTGDDDHTAPGGANGYTITVSNPNPVAVQLDAIIDTLPEGFGYTTGSTTGVTTADPAVAGGQLTWSGPFPVPASGQVTLHFGVVVASTPGTYLNNAGGSAQQPFTVSPTGDAAPVTVSTDPDPTP